MRIVLATILALCLCAASAQEQKDEPAPFQRLKTGEGARCVSESGCIAIDAELFRRLLVEATRRGAAACGRST